MKLRGGLYHNTQIEFAYNTNHIEGSKLTGKRVWWHPYGRSGQSLHRRSRIDNPSADVWGVRCLQRYK